MYENLLNPNEFSSISGVSKQTLLFYEKKNVFKPIFKNEKGFRFYSLEQLDIITLLYRPYRQSACLSKKFRII